MASFSDLIDVRFEERVSYPNTDGADVMGIVLPYFWGPVDQLRVYDRQGFFEAFPESIPFVDSYSGRANYMASKELFYAYAQVKKFFENGGAYVEVYAPSLLGVSSVTNTSTSETTETSIIRKYKSIRCWGASNTPAAGDLVLSMRYAGWVPQSVVIGLYPDYKYTPETPETHALKVVCTESDDVVTINVLDNTTPLETIVGQVSDPSGVKDGESTYLPNILSGHSLLKCGIVEKPSLYSDAVNAGIPVVVPGEINVPCIDVPAQEGTTASFSVSSSIPSQFSDVQVSRTTVLVSHLDSNVADSGVKSVAEGRKTCNYVLGLPTATAFEDAPAVPTIRNMWGAPVYGKELVSLFGVTRLLNCVGGYVGAMFNIAKTVRINQLASAQRYGQYVGTLMAAPEFSKVLEYHEKGIISIYSATNGPQIFGVHDSLYADAPGSYLSKWNVMRVVARLLRDVFPWCFEYLHTDVASNPSTRAVFATGLDNIMGNYTSKQNLQPDSYAKCDDDNNTDALTKGGKICNIDLSLHPIGLAERFSIRVIITDSTVTAEFV